MILSNLKDCANLLSLHPKLGLLLDFLNSQDLQKLPLGRNVIDGDDVFVNHDIVDARCKDSQSLEMHRKYIDVHILLQGEETIGIKPTSSVKNITTPYNEEKDFAFADEPADNYYTLHPGDILVAFPEDAHAPLIGTAKINKLIAKLLLP